LVGFPYTGPPMRWVPSFLWLWFQKLVMLLAHYFGLIVGFMGNRFVTWCPSYLLWLPTEGQTSAQYWEVVLITIRLQISKVFYLLMLLPNTLSSRTFSLRWLCNLG
jgi:hypothetical protein